MNKSAVILNGVLSLAVVILYVLYFTSGSRNQESSSKQENDKNKQEEIARKKKKEVENKKIRESNKVEIVYVNIDTLYQKYEYAAKIEKQLQTESNNLENNFANRQKQLEQDVMQAQKDAQEGRIKDQNQLQSRELDLRTKGMSIQQDYQTAGQNLLNKRNDFQEKVDSKIQKFLKKYSKESGYKMVLTFSKLTGGVLYAEDYLDVTEDVVEKLNAEYAQEK